MAQCLEKTLQRLQDNSDLPIEQRRGKRLKPFIFDRRISDFTHLFQVALTVCNEMPSLDLALIQCRVDLPKVTKLVWKGITKVLSCHHKALGEEIKVETFLKPLVVRLEDSLTTLEIVSQTENVSSYAE